MKTRRGAHTVYRLAYHFVWIPRYRRKVLKGDVAQSAQVALGWQAVGATGYYVGSAGEHVTSDLIKRYIEYQSTEDTGQARLF